MKKTKPKNKKKKEIQKKMWKRRLFGRMTGLASAAAPVMAAVSENSPGGGNSGSGERGEETAEEKDDEVGEEQKTEKGEEVAGAAAPDVATGNAGARAEENAPAAQDGEIDAETAGVYEFPDTKTSGTVTVVKKWDDQSTNAERPPVDMVNINLSTQKPSKNPLGYTVTFHADTEKGLTFADGSTENVVVYNGSGQVVSGGV